MSMLRDFRFAFRTLASRPVFTLVAALSLGLGISANSAIFSLVDALWFRPMAVPTAGEIRPSPEQVSCWRLWCWLADLRRRGGRLASSRCRPCGSLRKVEIHLDCDRNGPRLPVHHGGRKEPLADRFHGPFIQPKTERPHHANVARRAVLFYYQGK
jgi:hypothetical protein